METELLGMINGLGIGIILLSVALLVSIFADIRLWNKVRSQQQTIDIIVHVLDRFDIKEKD